MLEHILLWVTTFALSSLFLVYMWKYSFGRHPPWAFRLALAVVTIGGFSLFFYLFLKSPPATPFSKYDRVNFIGSFLAFLFMQVLRVFLEQLDIKARDRKFGFTVTIFLKNASDLFMNLTLFFGIYVIIIYVSVSTSEKEYWSYAWAGYTLSILSIIRILKFRIIDDLFRRRLGQGGSFIGPTTSVSTTLLQGIYNFLFRAYFMIAFSFACIYLLIYFNNGLPSTGNAPFEIAHPSGDLLVDFIYFSVVTMSTVGYGDILPVTAIPKLVSIFQILLGYFFLGSTFSYIFFVISARSDGINANLGKGEK